MDGCFSGSAIEKDGGMHLLYTGVTRAKKCVCIVGRKETFAAMIENEDQHSRYSGLKWQIANYYEETGE